MAIPVDDGQSELFWDSDGCLVERSTGNRLLDEQGNPIEWVDPEPDPNEAMQYEGPTIWAFSSYRYDLTPDTAVTIWVEAETLPQAQALYQRTAGAGLIVISCARWEPENLAVHRRWLAGAVGNLAAIVQER